MKRSRILFLFTMVLVLLASSALAATQSFSLPWWTVDSGGGTSTSSNFSLNGTIAQPDAGVLSGGGYTLGGGFWSGAGIAVQMENLYLPLVRR